jgi:molybdopterin-guanine dinucleotide biosynthesis protein A
MTADVTGAGEAAQPGDAVTGLVLAGGQGRRLGTVDTGLQMLRGKPLVEHVLERLKPQVDALIINATQNAEAYAELGNEYGARVVPDRLGGFAGPLAGLQAGLFAASTPLVVTVPCDSPFLPADLVARLHAALHANAAELAVAKTFDQPHPVFALVRTGMRDSLNAFLTSGGRKIDAWYGALAVVEVPFDDEAAAFENIKTLDELAGFESLGRR